jgi:hypothetical protein
MAIAQLSYKEFPLGQRDWLLPCRVHGSILSNQAETRFADTYQLKEVMVGDNQYARSFGFKADYWVPVNTDGFHVVGFRGTKAANSQTEGLGSGMRMVISDIVQ